MTTATEALPTLAISTLRRRKAAYNPRQISDGEMDDLRASLRKFGFLDPVIVNRTTGRIVGGHQRVEAAHLEGIKRAPVFYVDLDETEEKAANVALNRISGDWDLDALASLVSEIRETDAALLDVTGMGEDEVALLLAGGKPLDPEIATPSDLDMRNYTFSGDSVSFAFGGFKAPISETTYDLFRSRWEAAQKAAAGISLGEFVASLLEPHDADSQG